MKSVIVFLVIFSQGLLLHGWKDGYRDGYGGGATSIDHKIRSPSHRNITTEAWNRLHNMMEAYDPIKARTAFDNQMKLIANRRMTPVEVEMSLCNAIKNAVASPSTLSYTYQTFTLYNKRSQSKCRQPAQIFNAEEQRLAKAAARGYTMRLVDLCENYGSFKWRREGKLLTYSNWKTGQPIFGKRDSCVFMMADGLWEVSTCPTHYATYHILCENRPIDCNKIVSKPVIPAPVKPVIPAPVKPVIPAPVKPVEPAPVKPAPMPVKPESKFRTGGEPGPGSKDDTTELSNFKDLSLSMDIPYETVKANSKQFSAAFSEAMAKQMSIKENQVVVLNLRSGSTIVSFRLYQTKDGTPSISALQNLIDRGMFRMTFMGATIRPTPGAKALSLAPENKPSTLLVVLLVVTTLSIVVTAIVFILFCCIKRARPTEPQPEPNAPPSVVFKTSGGYVNTLGPPPEKDAPPSYKDVYKC